MSDGRKPAFPKRLGALLVLAALPGCGGKQGPAAPSLAPPEPTWRLTPGLASVSYDFSWPAQPGATSYLVEIGSTLGASDALSREVTMPSLAATLPAGPGIGDYHLRFRSKGPSGESAIKSTSAAAIDLRSVIEALFFETGARQPSFAAPPLDVIDETTRRFSAFAAGAVMLGWRPGSRVTVIASTALRDQQMQAARDTVDQFNLAVGGVVRASLVTTSDPDPRPRPGTITLAPGDPVAAGCTGNAIGCAVRTIEGGDILQARLVVAGGSNRCVTAHELGHGLHGFGHIALLGVEGIEDATMNPGGCEVGRMTQAEIDAIDLSYAGGMRSGAGRQDFVRAGLIAP